MEKRRQFLKETLKSALVTVAGGSLLGNVYAADRGREKYQVVNPYAHLNWEKSQQIASASHVHITDQQKLDKIYNEFKLRHIPISNYYPSAPFYPADRIRKDQFKVRQDFGVMYNPDNKEKGKERWQKASAAKGPFVWNDIIMNKKTGWYQSLPDEKRRLLPFKEGEKVFTNIPKDVIISPNAEHHSFTNSSLHSNAIGSLYCSGTFDAHDEFGTRDHGYNFGTGLPWQEVFKKMIDQLLFEDAGGISINHPVWSSLSFDEVCQMLDFDNRVLGIEIFNDTCATGYGDPGKGWAVKLWDEILKTKRKCVGFCVPDHTLGRGRNVLLVPAFTEYECLKAYRQGSFYGAIQGSGLAFTRIDLQDNKLFVNLNKRGRIRIVSDLIENIETYSGDAAQHTFPKNASGTPMVNYVRIEAWDDTSEQIYSQPIYFTKS